MFSLKSKQTVVVFFAALLVTGPYQTSEDSHVKASYEKAPLSDKINIILSDETLSGAQASVSIRSAETGEVLYENEADDRLKPASNMKLLTGAAALETLGAGYTFSTEVLREGDMKGNKLHGDLYLKGKGDPTLMEEDFEAMAQSLKDSGLREVKGNLIADDTWYDDIRLSEDLSWNDETRYYGSQISSLTASPNEDYDPGTVIVAAYPSDTTGEPADITVTPNNEYVEIVNQTKTVAAGQSKDLSIERKHGTNDIVIEGTVPVEASRSRSWVAVSEPSGLALDLFRQSLEKEGIKVKGKAQLNGETPSSAEVMVSKESMPLHELFIPFMKLSNNNHAEVLIKEMGRVVHGEGSWEKGLEVVEAFLEENGVGADAMRLRDGSGMSHVNMIPSGEISNLLFQIREKEWFPAYLESLPVAGHNDRFVGGTLRNRMEDTAAENNVQAKTGSLTGVTSLSGYVTTEDGEALIFSIVLNNYLGSVEEIEDRIAVTLAEHTMKPTDQ